MRVLLVNDYQTLGGVEVVVDRTASILRHFGHEVEMFTGDHCVRHQNPFGYISSYASKKALQRRLAAFAPDVVHIHNLYHLLSPAILEVCNTYRSTAGGKVVMTAHDHHLVCPNPGGCSWKNKKQYLPELPTAPGLASLLSSRWDNRSRARSTLRALQWWWNYSIKHRHLIPDAILSPSPDLAALIEHQGHTNVQVVPNPLPDVPDLIPTTPSDVLRIAVVGRVEPEKGIANLIDTWPASIQAQISVVGDGSELEECRHKASQRMAQESGLSIKFLGRLTHEDAIKVIANSDILAVPSLRPEVAPLVLDEARFVGTMLLVSNQPALSRMISSPNDGWVFDPNSPKDLAIKASEIDKRFRAGSLKRDPTPPDSSERSSKAYAAALEAAYSE